ncbi:hypothetical protein ACMD2_17353 [Ananas comosus]|uniref:FYR C-terminal domain-containing protein n=1 Tax=Ananas comosus TaxID=4615 RepID=A0A199VUE7_ANACO|nr:hypothetical protein ACMD2_17353 [Ananas comosus]
MENSRDEDLEITSVGSLYHGQWDKKYWSSSRLFGFRNPFVQRLLRELAVDVNRAPERCSLSPKLYDSGLQSDHKDAANAVNNESLRQSGCELEKDGKYGAVQQATSVDEGQCHPMLANNKLPEEVEHSDCVVEKHVISQEESKYYRDFRFPSVENIPYSAGHREGSPREIKDSLQEVSSSPSSSNPGSDKMDLDSEGQELAKFMMACLLPQAIPLLKKTYVRRKYRRENHEADFEQKVGDFHLTGDISQGEFEANNIVQRSEEKMSGKNDSGTSVQDSSECKKTTVKPSDNYCLPNNEQSSERSNEVKYVIPDSLEDDPSVFNVRANKSSPADYCETIHGYPNEIKQNFEPSKLPFSIKEGVVEPSNLESCEYNGVVKPFNELEKGDLFLSDSLLAGLEEEFNGDSAGDKNEISYWELNYQRTDCADHILSINPASHEHDSLQHLCNDKNSFRKDLSVPPPEGNCKPTGNDITEQYANDLLPCSEYTSLDEREFSRITNSGRMLDKSQDDLESSIQHKLVNFDVPNVPEFTDVCAGNLHQMKRNVPEQSRKCALKEFSCPDAKQLADMATDNDHKDLCHDKPCKRSHFDELSSHDAESLAALDRSMELVGCFLHPSSILSISLSSNDHSLQISVLCGLLEDSAKSLYIYVVPLQEQSGICPSFTGYTSLMLPPLEGPFKGNLTFERAGLQFTPDGHSLILLNSIKVPYCRKHSVACLCPMCKLDQCDDNAVKIVRVNFGYVSPLIKLTTDEKVCCILVCEPNWLIAVQESGKLHVWTMNLEWSTNSEEYVLPSFDDLPCPMLELKRVTNANSLVIGHNGIGGFGLWDISKRACLASFSAPGNIVFQIIPVGFCSLQNYGILFTNNNEEESLKEMMAKDLSKEAAEIPVLISSGEDAAVWLMVSAASVTEVQHDLQVKDHSIRWWRLALLAKNLVFMGSMLDPRASVVAASAEYGFVGTFDGLLYKWELSTGRKYADMCCFKCGSVPCIGVDARSDEVAFIRYLSID